MTCGVCLLHTMTHQRGLLGRLLVAACLSSFAVVVLLGLDKVGDHWKSQTGGERILLMLDLCVGACALMVGVSWEICFVRSMHAIGYHFNHFMIGIFLVLMVTPSYRLFMLPELEKRQLSVLEETQLARPKCRRVSQTLLKRPGLVCKD
eukprot:TRINITY_DN18525_c1_g1_i1.p1 TRINITY_DN18525_c1_g1~~TRINITY_DN18525_c1_g1_i1.p1  ORF type:complete len:149 (-),score=15.60 TRINITY_DN18525_c1_g1_i1:112-558(-)